MRKSLIAALLSFGIAGSFCTRASAAFVKMDDFESAVGTNTWAGSVIVDPADAGNHVAGGTDFGKALLPAAIDNDQTGTIFFRTYLTSTAAVNSFAKGIRFGSTDLTLDEIGTNSFSETMQTNAYFGNAAFNPLAGLNARQWYDVWIVVNNATDTARYYLTQDGNLPDPASPLTLGGVSDFPFQFGTDQPIIAVGIDSSAYLDDVYVDPTSANLTSPVPEPACLLPLLALGYLPIRRRMQRSPR